MFRFWPNHYQWSFQLVRGMATAPWGGAQVGECLATAARMREGDQESWHREWLATANRVESLGDSAAVSGHFPAAQDAYGRASQYYRLAEFFLDPEDPRKVPTYLQMRNAFRQYAKYVEPHPERVEIPYGDSFISGYFLPHGRRFSPARGQAAIVLGGLESVAEEVYFAAGRALAAWGVHVLVIDGPGQGESIRLRDLAAVHDFESAVTPAVDYLRSRQEVDPDRIGLVGFSLGGYYVARAAAFEHRLKALVIWGAQWDYGEVWRSRPDDHPLARHLRMIMGTRNMEEARARVAKFTLRDCIGEIRCPTLVTHGSEDEHVPVTHAHRVYEHLRCPKTLKVFSAEEGGSAHCQWDNLHVAHHWMFSWLEDRLSG